MNYYGDCKSILYDLTFQQVYGPLQCDLSHYERILANVKCECVVVKSDKCNNIIATIPGDSEDLIVVLTHIDVVPGSSEIMKYQELKNGEIRVRGAVDMKGCIASLLYAIQDIKLKSTVMIIMVGDEEVGGTGASYVSDIIRASGRKVKFILCTEPTSINDVGDNVKTARNSSTVINVSAHAQSGHVAYLNGSQSAANILIRRLNRVMEYGFEHCHVVDFKTEFIAENSTPSSAHAKLAIRTHMPESNISNMVSEAFDGLEWQYTSRRGRIQSSICQEKMNQIVDAIFNSSQLDYVTAINDGGSSDMLYFYDIAPHIELGLISKTIHREDEHTSEDDMAKLSKIYGNILRVVDKW